MVFAEQLRNLENEENLFEDATEYKDATVKDWTTKITKSITLTETKKIVVRTVAEWYSQSGSYVIDGAVRICLDGVPLVSSGYDAASNTTKTKVLETFLELAAGTYSFTFQLSVIAATSSNTTYDHISLYDSYIGKFNVTDIAIANGDSGDVSCAASADTVVISKVFTTPATRKTPIGNTKKINAVIIVNGLYTDSGNSAVNVMKNTGESNTSNRLNWKIFVNTVQKDWDSRQDDYQPTQPTYAEGAYGRASEILELNTEYTIEVKCYNAFAAAKLARAYISVIYGPWILSDETLFEPVTLDIPHGSTVYMTVEPFSRNENSTVSIGKKRAVSFGDSTNYYTTNTGTGIKNFSYTFETVYSDKSVLVAYGFGAIIAMIGVDVR